MNIFLIGLIVIVLLVDCYSLKQIKGGLFAGSTEDESEMGWVSWNFLLCIVLGAVFVTILHYTLGTGFSNQESPLDWSGDMGIFLLIGGCIWVLNMIFMAVVVNCCLEGYIKYRQGCLRLGVDLKDHVDKFFVTTNKTWTNYNKVDGLDYDTDVRLQKIVYNKSWLGEYPYMKRVTTLVTLPEVKLQKDIISKYVQDYFNARGQYQVDGTELKVLDKTEMDVIIIK